ncbi:sigma-70 family RNA polymerase sigma factor [Mycolicibacterium conceptionense]|uniref:Sigma-70 family RNA polymerase sigma factor n=1 Tax=Mycolicibacterium conceptionense TaxID=451644 RepID=A0A0U1DXZ0_9MYCO|nr:sigma-70 family RNA polymerase sigma factor [Mycolicibacterium conceptionense]
MNESAGLEAAWHDHHPYLVNLAYRMLGDIGEAEDVAQEAFLRLARADQDQLDDVRAWLTVVAGRLSLDVLRSARARLENPDLPRRARAPRLASPTWRWPTRPPRRRSVTWRTPGRMR